MSSTTPTGAFSVDAAPRRLAEGEEHRLRDDAARGDGVAVLHGRSRDDDAERLKLALAAGQLGWWEWDVASGVVTWSPEVEAMHGMAPGTFAGTFAAYLATIHPEDRTRVTAEIERIVAERRERYAVRYRYLRREADGAPTTRWLEGQACLLLDRERGRPQRLIGVVGDATQRVEAAEAAEFLIEAAAVLGGSLHIDETLEALSRLAVPRLADWCAIDLLESGEVRRVGIHHADPAKLAIARTLVERNPTRLDDATGVGAVLRTGRSELVAEISDEHVVAAARDPEQLALARTLGFRSYIVVPLEARGGRRLGALTLVQAESGRRYDEATLRVAQELARRAGTAMDNARLYDEARREAEWRAAANAELTARAEQLQRQTEQLQQQRAELEMANAQLQEQQVELEAQTTQLQEQQVELEAQTQQLQEQQVELEMTNARLQENAVELELQAEELLHRTRDLEREAAAAEEARRAAEEANAAKSQFLAAMSHELRTPLNAVTGYADLLAMGIRGSVTEAQREDLARIKRSGEHLLRLINDILQFAKLEAGQLEFRPSDVSLVTTLAELETLVAPQVRAREVHYEFVPCAPDPSGAPLAVRADRDKLQQIVLNLLSNAIKATEAGGSIRLECGLETQPNGQERVVVRVADTGVGIPPDKLETIFDPFVQVDRKLNRPSDGVGLGLAISRDLARAMGGDLVAESAVGKGSTFTLWLPRLK